MRGYYFATEYQAEEAGIVTAIDTTHLSVIRDGSLALGYIEDTD